jgi:predicted naringenin-chalcone synthase
MVATSILGIGTAHTGHVVDQALAAERYVSLLTAVGADRRAARLARLLFARSGVRSRQFAVQDVDESGKPLLYKGHQLPGTSDRMEVFSKVAPALAEEACRRALDDARVAPARVTSLVIATCTGVGAPDLDVELVERLGLAATVERSLVVWMSCTGSFPALRIARRAVESQAGAVALVVCVELCSLHVRANLDPGSLVAHSLFADGASALVVGCAPPSDSLALLGDGATRLVLEGRAALRWTFSDHGFRAHLGDELSTLVEKATPGFVRELVGERFGDVRGWCVHPGGPAILDAVETALRLAPAALDRSRAVLETLGNMSSATIWYVLERALGDLHAGELGVLLGFGTGLTLEGLVFERGGRPR